MPRTEQEWGIGERKVPKWAERDKAREEFGGSGKVIRSRRRKRDMSKLSKVTQSVLYTRMECITEE